MASPDSQQGGSPWGIRQPDIVVSTAEEHQEKSTFTSSDEGSNFPDAEDGMSNIEWRNRVLQEHFASGMKDISQERSHKKAAVLLLEWEKEGEDYMDTREEVRRLAEVFKSTYNFSVHTRRLTLHKGPARHQMNAHLANFIWEEDSEDSLLIIYYAGHGITRMKDDNLILVGGNPEKGNKSLTQIVWTESEQQLDRTSADVLVIFDCCHAGVLTRNMRAAPFSRKIFEYIGSTPYNKKARGPGDDSFTTALIWSLSELATQPEGFTTSKLIQKIENAPHFKETGQIPVSSERGKKPCLFKLKIEPLPLEGTAQQEQSADNDPLDESNLVSLQLQFIFGRCPSKKDLSRLTKALSNLVKFEQVPIKKVLWDGLEEYQKMDFSHVARRMAYKIRRRSIARKLKFDPTRLGSPQGSYLTESPQIDSATTQVDSDSTLISEGLSPTAPSILSRKTARHVDIFITNFRAYVQAPGISTIWLTSAPSPLLLFLIVFTASAGYDVLRFWTAG